MNADQLIAHFRQFPIDYVTNNYRWDDDVVLGWFNEAEREACIRARLIFDSTTENVCSLDLAAGTATYQTHDAIIEIQRAFIVKEDGMQQLYKFDRDELDRTYPEWRTKAEPPTGFVQDDKTITLNRVPVQDGEARLEVYRLPLSDMTGSSSVPEIAPIHHVEMVNWVCYRALSSEDFEELEGMQQRGEKYLRKFEAYFGRKPNADLRRRQRTNVPHSNKCHW